MTVRTRKTITDLIQQLKVQEKEIKSGLSDGQRRLNETRDRISTLYWVIEEIGDSEAEEEVEENDLEESDDLEIISREEWENLVKTYPNLSFIELADILFTQKLMPPSSYAGCPCPECVSTKEAKAKPKKKTQPKKKPIKKTKKGKK